MSQLKTQPTDESVQAFIEAIENDERKQDCLQLLQWIKKITQTEPKLWSSNIVGFDSYHYKYATGREGDWFITGFSPRKQALTLYIMAGFDRYEELMQKLGKFKTGKSCLYIKRLSDVNETVLKELITESVAYMRKQYH